MTTNEHDDSTVHHTSGPGVPFPEGMVEWACEVMHDAYERAAVGAGWETQEASRKPWAEVPEANQVTMRAAVGALLKEVQRTTLVKSVTELQPGQRLVLVFGEDAAEHQDTIAAAVDRWHADPQRTLAVIGGQAFVVRDVSVAPQ